MSCIRANLKNKKYGRLIASEFVDTDKGGNAIWQCVCDCGKTIIALAANLKSGATKSCGCFQKENAKIIATIHGMSYTRLYEVWHGMKQRCGNKSDYHFKNWGSRGIKVCSQWHDFNIFKEWALSNGYHDNLTIDRIDNDGDYKPSNCQWLTRSENTKKANISRGFKTAQNLA